MEEKRVEIIYFPDGTKKIEAIGYTGGECEKVTEPFTKDHEKLTREYKPDYYKKTGLKDGSKLCG